MSGHGHEVRWCFHTTAMVADYERTRDALIRLAGLRVLEDSRLDDPAIGRRGGMAWLGDNVIEIGDIPLVLYPIPSTQESERLWGWTYDGPQTCNVGVAVPDLDAARVALATAEVPIHRDGGDHVVIAPQVTGGVTLVVVDR